MKTFLYPLELKLKYFKYYKSYNRKRKDLGYTPIILSALETLDYILKNKCSVSRYGDGEFNIIREIGNGFCAYHPFLSQKLQEVLTMQIPNHIVCIPKAIFCQENLIFQQKVFWRAYFCKAYKILKKNLKKQYTYSDASFTRFYLPYKNKDICKEYIQKIKKIWDRQEIILIEGEYSRLGVNNDLFSNVRSLQRILCPSSDAYTKYQDILEQAVKLGKNKLVLLALGQTATCLAYDLTKLGLWAIDIGHIDIEYEWFRCNAKHKIKIQGKHVNEVGYLPCEETFQNTMYENQIVVRLL